MAAINLNIDIIDRLQNSNLTYALQQGNNNVSFVFTLTENGVPIVFNEELDLSIYAYVNSYNRLDFKSSIVECSGTPAYEFISDEEETPTYTLQITLNTSDFEEILANPYKNSITLKINTVSSETETFYSYTTPFEYNVLSSESYTLNSLVSSEE